MAARRLLAAAREGTGLDFTDGQVAASASPLAMRSLRRWIRLLRSLSRGANDLLIASDLETAGFDPAEALRTGCTLGSPSSRNCASVFSSTGPRGVGPVRTYFWRAS